MPPPQLSGRILFATPRRTCHIFRRGGGHNVRGGAETEKIPILYFRNAILYEPESRDETRKLEDHFGQLKGNLYYTGYAVLPAEIACDKAVRAASEQMHGFRSVATCLKAPDTMAWNGREPNDYKGWGENCVESHHTKGLNDIPCDWGGRRINRIVCQFSQECPSNYEMAEGILDKCFLVASADGNKHMDQAKKFCEDR